LQVDSGTSSGAVTRPKSISNDVGVNRRKETPGASGESEKPVILVSELLSAMSDKSGKKVFFSLFFLSVVENRQSNNSSR
jgi:hypothetical protein